MKKSQYHFTSESVSEGHPDKVADQISDAILDAYLKENPDAKVACECLITKNHLTIAGEVKTMDDSKVDAIAIARQVIRGIGYTNPEYGFDVDKADFTLLIHRQSQEINDSVSDGGAGDQGMMFGYACDETPALMPLPVYLAHQIVMRLSALRKDGSIPWLLPDAKSQVTVIYEDGEPAGIDNIVVSTQHMPYMLNAGSAYQGSGHAPSKVDRSAAYMARFVAKHLVAAGIAKRCSIQLSYAIGRKEPTSVHLDFHGTGSVPEQTAHEAVSRIFQLTPEGIISTLDLKRPIYRQTAAYGHFGRDGFPWEQIDPSLVDELKRIYIQTGSNHPITCLKQ